MGAAAACSIIAYLSLGALLQLLVRNLAFGLSLTGIICSPAFGFAGVGFPVLAMNGFARAWGAMLPLRWYIQILFDQAARGVPARDSRRALHDARRAWRWPISASPGCGCARVARRSAAGAGSAATTAGHGPASSGAFADGIRPRARATAAPSA